MHQTVLVLMMAALLTSVAPSHAAEEQLSDEKRTDITTLLGAVGALEVGGKIENYVVGQMTDNLKETRPDIPAKMYDVLQKEVHVTIEDNLDELEALLIPVYHKHFSHKEIQGLLAFYRTDLGKKMVKLTPIMAQESLESGRQWGRIVAPEIRKRVTMKFKEHGYEM